GLTSAARARSVTPAVPMASFFSVMYWLKVRSWPSPASSSFIRAHMASRSCRNSRPRLAPLLGKSVGFMRRGILLAQAIVVKANIVPATGCAVPVFARSGLLSGRAVQDQLQHELGAEERQHQQRHRRQRSEERRVGKA